MKSEVSASQPTKHGTNEQDGNGADATTQAHRILIVEDHPLTADGISSALKGGGNFEIVGVASNGIEAIAKIKSLAPDCAILDLSLPGANGVEVFAEARRWSPHTRFVVLTGLMATATFRELISHGINGIFLKTGSSETICDRIRRVCEGEDVIAPEVLESVVGSISAEGLTLRELEVLHAIARGWTNANIAQHLGISPKTVDSHRTSLMRKLKVHSTATLLVKAMRDGIIDVTENSDTSPAPSQNT